MGASELKLWNDLRNGKIGFRVRRQFAVGPYVLDFYICQAKLCIEVDGEVHDRKADSDLLRDAYLERLGIATMRIRSWELWGDFDFAESIRLRACERLGVDP